MEKRKIPRQLPVYPATGPRLEDLTKEQLILLIRKRGFGPSVRDIAGAIWEDAEDRAAAMMDTVCANPIDCSTPQGYQKMLEMDRLFNKGLALSAEATEIYDRWIVPKEKTA